MYKVVRAFSFMSKSYKVGDECPDNLAKYVGARVEKVEVVKEFMKRANKAILGSTKQVKVTKK